MAHYTPPEDARAGEGYRELFAELWRNRLNPSRPGAGRETLSGKLIHLLLFLTATLSVFVTLGIILVLIFDTLEFFREVPFGDFFGSTTWSPLFSNQQFGVWALVAGTVMIAVIALLIAVPLGLLAAIFLSEYAPPRVHAVLKPALEVLAGVPTVVYGYFALLFVSPIVRDIFAAFGVEVGVFSALSAGVVLGVMIIPMVSSLSEDAFSAVPQSLREGAYALGSTRMETAVKVVLPAALSGVVASVILATSRAIGETIIVTIAAGANPQFTANPLEAVQTMTAFIVQLSLGDTPTGSLEFKALFAVATTLFVMTLGMNVVAQWVARRFRQAYE